MGWQIGGWGARQGMGYQIGRMGYQIGNGVPERGKGTRGAPCPHLAPAPIWPPPPHLSPAPVWHHPSPHLALPLPPICPHPLAIPICPPPIWLGWRCPPMFVSLSSCMGSISSHMPPSVQNNIFHLAWKNSQNSCEATPFPSIRHSTSH